MNRSANPSAKSESGQPADELVRASLQSALGRRLSAVDVKPVIEEALLLAGRSELPSDPADAQEFVTGPLKQVLTARVGPALAQHWLAELVLAVQERRPASDARPRPVERTERDLTPVDTTIDPWLGRTLEGRYRVLQKVGDGARGGIYRAERISDGARVAVKLVGPALHQAQSRFEARFQDECRIAKSLTHPNTLVVYDHGRADEKLLYVAVEWLSGIDLSRMLNSRGPLNARQAMYLAHQVCRSLAHAHAQGVVHADMSPEGIFVARQPGGISVVKLMDYGRRRVAGLNDEGQSQIGLPQDWARYLAPEQITGEDYDHRADLYALGAILYEGLSGQRPFPDSTGIGIWMSQVHDRPPPLRGHAAASAVPEAVEQLVMRCLEKDPSMRFETAEELVEITATLSR